MVYFLCLIGVYSNNTHFLPALLPKFNPAFSLNFTMCLAPIQENTDLQRNMPLCGANPTRETLSSAFPQLLLAPKTEIYYDRIGKNRGKEGQP